MFFAIFSDIANFSGACVALCGAETGQDVYLYRKGVQMAEKRLQGSESSVWDFRGKKIPGEVFQKRDPIIDSFGAIVVDEYGYKLVELKTDDILLEAYFAYKRLLLTSSDYNAPGNRARLIIIHKAIDDIQRSQILQGL